MATSIEVISKPPVQYTSEARTMHIQGDVVLRVTFTAAGQVVVQGVVRGLGHGLDEEARRVASQIRFHPATRNGQPIDTSGPSIFQAVRQQLGLRLDPRKGPVQVMVVDHVEKPSEN